MGHIWTYLIDITFVEGFNLLLWVYWVKKSSYPSRANFLPRFVSPQLFVPTKLLL